jgi:hypothetical protein
MEARKADFQKHHKNVANLLFHIACGIVYISLFFTLFPIELFLIYSITVLLLFPNIAVALALPVVFYMRNYSLAYKLPLNYVIPAIFIGYCLPELSHYITGEKTVLKIHTVSVVDIIDNFFLLLPNSLLALTS